MIYWLEPHKHFDAEMWLRDRIEHIRDGELGPAQYAAVFRSEDVAAVVAFHSYDPRTLTMQLTMAADDPRWCRKRNVAELLAYPFERAGINKLFTTIPGDNVRAIKVNEGLGLKVEAELAEMFGPGRSAVMCGMTRADWLASKWRKVLCNG